MPIRIAYNVYKWRNKKINKKYLNAIGQVKLTIMMFLALYTSAPSGARPMGSDHSGGFDGV